MTLTDRHLRLCAYIISEEIGRRQRFGHQIPSALRDLDAALNCALSADGHETLPTTPDPSRWKTTEQLAAESGCTARTVRRRAAAAGAVKIGGQWIFDQEQT